MRKNERLTKALASIADCLQRGGVGVIPTDTLYGVVGSALQKGVVERIYQLRKRNLKKPMIILISDIRDLKKFHIKMDAQVKTFLRRVWPGTVSVVLPCTSRVMAYLHRGMRSLAFRLPRDRALRHLIAHIGPLVAPSANIEGKRPAITIRQAKHYFGDHVDFYIDAGARHANPSTLVRFNSGQLIVLRQGNARV